MGGDFNKTDANVEKDRTMSTSSKSEPPTIF